MEKPFFNSFYFSDIPEDQHEIHLTGRFSWMACSRICMPSTTKLSLTIPVVREPLADLYLAEKFKRFWQKQPQDLPDSWEFQAFSMGKFINLRFPRSLSKNTNRMEFFGEDRTVLSNQTRKFEIREIGWSGCFNNLHGRNPHPTRSLVCSLLERGMILPITG